MSLSLMRRFLDVLPDIFLILNEQRQAVFSNQALLTLLGLQGCEQDWGQRPGELLHCIHAGAGCAGCGTTEFCRTCGAVRAILSGLQGIADVQECRIIQETGDALDLRVWADPLLMGGERYTTLCVRDIGPEKRRKALERIFLHDLLNSAVGLQGFTKLLKEVNLGDMEEQKEPAYDLASSMLEEIRAQKDLLAAEAHELQVHPSTVNSLDILREVAGAFNHHLAAEGRRVEIAPGAQAVDFVSARTLLRRVLISMVKNAVEACRPGETATLTCASDGKEIEFRVHNPACMPRDVQLQVFQRSFSTKGAGRGLGTYSMKLLSERYLKGSVSFTTTPDEGTTFIARYPLTLAKDL